MYKFGLGHKVSENYIHMKHSKNNEKHLFTINKPVKVKTHTAYTVYIYFIIFSHFHQHFIQWESHGSLSHYGLIQWDLAQSFV